LHDPKIDVPTKRPATNILQATSKLVESFLDESVTFSNLCGTEAGDKSTNAVWDMCDSKVRLIMLQVQRENFLSNMSCYCLCFYRANVVLCRRRLVRCKHLIALPNEVRMAIPAIPRFCSELTASIHSVIHSMSTQTHLANHRRVPRALTLLGVFLEACRSSRHACEAQSPQCAAFRGSVKITLTPHIGPPLFLSSNTSR
jgi:hypothetical protein